MRITVVVLKTTLLVFGAAAFSYREKGHEREDQWNSNGGFERELNFLSIGSANMDEGKK
jgi:hypothetical protein